MNLSLPMVLRAARLSVERPRVGARQILNLNLATGEAWVVVGLMAVSSTLLAEIGNVLAPYEAEPMVMEFFANPVSLALLQLTVMGGTALIAHALGRWAGGMGSFAGALILMGWLQAILLLLQLLQLLLILVAPPLAPPLGVIALVLFGWLLTNFIAELHGFQSLGKVFLGIVATMILLSLVLTVVMVFVLGVQP